MKIEKYINVPNKLNAPISKGDVVGTVEYRINNQVIGKSNILSTQNIEKIDFWTLFVKILSKFLIK